MSRRTVIVGILVGLLAVSSAGIGGFALWQRAEQQESESLLAEARSEARAGKPDEAMRLFSKYLALRTGDVAVRREYADVLLAKLRGGKLGGRGDLAAFKLLETVVRESPDDHWVRFQLAKFQEKIGQHTSAIEHLKNLQQACGPDGRVERKGPEQSGPDDSVDRQAIDVLLAECLAKTGQFREAVNILAPLVGFDPVARRFVDPAQAPQSGSPQAGSSHSIFDRLANILGENLDDEAAGERVVIQNTVINANDSAAWISLGRWKYLYGRDIPAAQQAVKKAVEISPDDSMVMYCNFMISQADKQYDEIEALAERGLELHPDQEWPYEAKAIVGLHNRDVASTVGFLIAGLKKPGGRPALLQRLVDLPDEPAWNDALREGLGDIGPALEREQRFRLVLDARKLMIEHRWLDALALLEQARPLAAASPPLKLTIDLAQAKCHARLGDTDLQLSACQRAVTDNPQSVEARAGLANALLACGQLAMALKEFRRAAASLSASDLAERPEIWGPLVRLERTAIERRSSDRQGRAEVDNLVESLREHVAADQAPLLDAASDGGESIEATTADDGVSPSTADDLGTAMKTLGRHLRGSHAEEAKAAAARVEAIAGPESTHGRYAKAAVWALEKRLISPRLPTRERAEAEAVRKQLTEIELKRPDWPELNCLVAEVDLLEGKTDEAIARYQRALAARPSDVHIARLLATLLMKSHRFAEAEQVLAGLDPAVVDRLGRIAVELRLRAGKTDDAVKIALRAAETNSVDADDLLWLAELLAGNGHPAEAAKALERGVGLAPERLDLWLALADLQASANGPPGPSDTLERAIQAVPETQRELLQAEAARQAGRLDEAAAAFRTMLEQPTKDMLLLRRATKCFADAGHPDEARATLDRMMRIRPRTSVDEQAKRWAHRQLAELLLREGTFPDAEKALELLVENSGGVGSCTPEDTDLAARLLSLRPEPRSWNVAKDLLEALAKKQPLTVSQKVLLARLFDRLGTWRTARADLLSMALEPAMPAEVYATLVELLLAHDEASAAERWFRELKTLAASAPETLVLEARLARASGDKAAAAQAAKQLMPDRDVTPATLAADLETASTLEGLGFPKAADKLLGQAAQAGSDGIVARIVFLMGQERSAEAEAILDAALETAHSPDLDLIDAERLEAKGHMDDAEKAYRRLLDAPLLSAGQRARATARLLSCLVDREEIDEAKTLAEKAILELGPHPDLLDARGLVRVASGDVGAALQDFTEAERAASPIRLLHSVHAFCLVGDGPNAQARLQQAVRLGLKPAALSPSDRKRLDYIAQRLGIALR